jgi:hypothetical protein
VRGAGTAVCGLPPLSVWLYKTWWKTTRVETGAKMGVLAKPNGVLNRSPLPTENSVFVGPYLALAMCHLLKYYHNTTLGSNSKARLHNCT